MATLCSLAPELLDLILDKLCIDHAQYGLIFRGHDYHFDSRHAGYLLDGMTTSAPSLAALANLCRTSKLFQNLGTSRLYHTLAPGSNLAPRWWLLARTLVTNPRLAALVRHMVFVIDDLPSPPWDEPVSVPTEVASYFAQRVATAIPNDVELAESLSDPFGNFRLLAIQSLFTSLCNDIRTLRCVIEYHDFNFALCTPGSLPSLRRLELRYRYDWSGQVEAAQMLLLLAAAPELVYLRLVQPTGEIPGPSNESNMLRQVNEVEFKCAALDAHEFASWLRACPALGKLQYECGGEARYYGEERYDADKQFSFADAVGAVVQYAPRLREFALEMAQWKNERRFTDEQLVEAKEALEARGVVCRFSIYTSAEERWVTMHPDY